jgi:arabinose-5-phosphate isomerase
LSHNDPQSRGGSISRSQIVAGINILDEIARVLDIEIEALRSVRLNISSAFVRAVELIAACRGQVLVSGIGKSGIIGAKIAATFRSTGTPAAFLHPGDALHGDVGTVREDDVLLAIGKSGESTELNAVLRVVRKIGIPIIAITSNSGSSMAALSDVVIDLQIPREACPLNLAPTASTTAALAVGDAIAVALMKLKNVSAEDFARHHPGGQLGKRLLLTVEDVMRPGSDKPVIQIQTSVKEMLVAITAFHVGAICVADEQERLLGLVTDYDVRKMLETGQDIFAMKISDIMNTTPEVAYSTDRAVDALERMRARNKPIAVLPVLSADRRILGIIHLHDLIAAGL